MPPPTVDSWSPADSLLTVGGVPITGYAPGTFIEIKRNSPAATMQEGEDGSVTVARSLKRSGTITVTLRRGAPSNTYLGSLAAAFENSPTGPGVYFDVQYENLNSPTNAHTDQAFVQQLPDAADAADGGTSKWAIVCPIMDYTVAGAIG